MQAAPFFFMLDYKEIIKECLFKDGDFTAPEPVITIKGHVIGVPQNFITINGLPKSRKTTFANYFIASGITGRSFFDIQVNIQIDEKIILFDTEQSIFDFSRQIKTLKNAIQSDNLPDNFSAYLFRKYEPKDILNTMYLIIKEQKPKLIIIDNLTELVINPNDMAEAKAVIQFLKKITAEFNLTCICLLHLNKNNMLSIGNLGSMADRGAQSVLKVTHDKDSGASTLEPVFLRSSNHFEPISINYNTDLKKYEQTTPQNTQPRKKFVLASLSDSDHINRINVIYLNAEQFTYAEIIEEIKRLYGVGTNIAKQQILPYLIGNKFLKTNKGIYTK